MGDARTERWIDHKIRVRQQLVDSAFSTIDAHGPHVSMREIAAQAKVPKASLYRFFADKSDIYHAVGDRMNQMIVGRIVALPESSMQTIGELLHAGIVGFVDTLVAHPNVFRFLMTGLLANGAADAEYALENARGTARTVAVILEDALKLVGVQPVCTELDAYMLVGVVSFAGEWWLSRTADEPTSVPEFIDRIEASLRAMVQVAAIRGGREIDFDEPLSPDITSALSGARS